jgi:hypothetical protein
MACPLRFARRAVPVPQSCALAHDYGRLSRAATFEGGSQTAGGSSLAAARSLARPVKLGAMRIAQRLQ